LSGAEIGENTLDEKSFLIIGEVFEPGFHDLESPFEFNGVYFVLVDSRAVFWIGRIGGSQTGVSVDGIGEFLFEAIVVGQRVKLTRVTVFFVFLPRRRSFGVTARSDFGITVIGMF
jgi:hypothetical protein